jgi:beta-lactamase class A
VITRRQLLVASAAVSVSRATVSAATRKPLLEEWREIARTTDGTVGAAALWIDTGRTVNLNGDERCPLASVCKLPLAMNILALVDEGKLALNQEIEIPEHDLWPPVSDIAAAWPKRRSWPLNEILEVMVAHSDNTAVEIVYRMGGGGAAMAARFREWKIDGVRIDRSERECNAAQMGATPEASYKATLRYLADARDTGTANGTVQLLGRLFRGELLSKASTARMIEMLKSTTTGPMRLNGLLPAGTIVAHKTGTTGVVKRLAAGTVAAATNDSGVIFLPSGAQLAISVYVKASTRNEATRERVIARIARAAYESSL